MSPQPILCEHLRPLKRSCLQPSTTLLDQNQNQAIPNQTELWLDHQPPKLVRRNGASRPMVTPSQQLPTTTTSPLVAISCERSDDAQPTPVLSPSPSSQSAPDDPTRQSDSESHSQEPPTVVHQTISSVQDTDMIGVIPNPIGEPTLEDPEDGEYDIWDDYDQAEMAGLDELDAQRSDKPDHERDVFYEPPSTSRPPPLAIAAIPNPQQNLSDQSNSSSSSVSSPTRSIRNSPEPPTRYTSFFTTGHKEPQPIMFATASGSSFSLSNLPFRAPSKVASQTFPTLQPELPNITQSDHRSSQAMPMLGFKTGHGRIVPPPSKEAVQRALEGLATTDVMSSPNRSARLPDSPTPQTRVLKGLPSPAGSPSISARNPSPQHQAEAGLSRSEHSSVPSKRSFADQQDARDRLAYSLSSSKTLPNGSRTAYGNQVVFPQAIADHRRSDESMDTRSILLRPQQPRSPGSRALEEVSNRLDRSPRSPVTPPPKPVPSIPLAQASLPSTPRAETPVPTRFVGPHLYPKTLNRRTITRPIGLTPQSVQLFKTAHIHGPRAFVTPFKPTSAPGGAKYGTKSIFSASEQHQPTPKPDYSISRSSRLSISLPDRKSVIDLRPFMAPNRIPISNWLSPPKALSPRQLFSQGVPESIVFMSAKSARLWHFDSLSDNPFGPLQALGELYKLGCIPSKANPNWIANHWALIVWKLSGIVRWKPQSRMRVWNPEFVLRQLKYRYEREFNYGHRSAIRLILDHECPAGVPMTLVIVSIKLVPISKGSGIDETTVQQSRIELSDGWYKIRATIDEPLSRAIRNGRLKVGHKLAIGATFVGATDISKTNKQQEEADPELKLEGNSTARARWHESLGIRFKPWFASLRSLSFDGGRVGMVDVIVVRVFGTMFVDEKGGGERWGGEEEVDRQAEWEIARQTEADKISLERQEEQEQVFRVRDLVKGAYEGGYPANGKSAGGEEQTGFDVDEWLEGLMNESIDVRKASTEQLKELLEGTQDLVDQFERTDVQKILDERVPPRRIRQVCTLRIRDFQSFRDPEAQRTAQLLVQDLSRVEEDLLKEGHRYWIQNIQPQRKIVWDARQERAELFLCTRRDTKWRRVGLDD
ncbi:hypothetical protein CROQUDRAFT_659820 [Cronartium quercuum f. sp. fusiforme G11]|uniref:BRCA2 OB1 domain-containing protein n=1 Tax=Cronartium quercuum f. sp. fusiforme G11 TaxID=708437 RepID=A0A9P6NIF1_9BASI|nr:hypothetical protein CROQUDRAFT_659820 [Cronartium quercuum f. sp. fusiforme G11]